MDTVSTTKLPGRSRNRPLKNYAGHVFGRLTAVSLVERDATANNNHKWLFMCECGTEKVAGIRLVRTGHTKSCGCLFTEMLVARNTTHGLLAANRGTYRSWKDMRSRCRNENNSDYGDYGGRGISVHPSWDNFAVFLGDMGARPSGLSLDRIDVNGNYEPGTCRWATATEQANNKRSNSFITMNGVTKTLQEWCVIHGMDHSKAAYRLKAGLSPEDAFSSKDFRIENPSDPDSSSV